MAAQQLRAELYADDLQKLRAVRDLARLGRHRSRTRPERIGHIVGTHFCIDSIVNPRDNQFRSASAHSKSIEILHVS